MPVRPGWTTIMVSQEVKAALMKMGRKGEKYNDILERILTELGELKGEAQKEGGGSEA